jgi:hypothetical protein
MDNGTAELVHRVLSLARKIESHEQDALFSIGEAFLQLKQSEAWLGYYPEAKKSWRKFLVASGFKPQTIENAMRITERFGPIVQKENVIIVTSRLAALLPIKQSDNDRTYVLEMAQRDVPHDHYISALDRIKKRPEKPICEHLAGREVWNKCKGCGAWIKDPIT